MARKGARDPRREESWRATLQRRQESGLTVREFCRRQQLSEAAYYFWQREIGRRDRKPRLPPRRERPKASVARTKAGRRPMTPLPLFQELAVVDGRWRSGTDGWLEIVLPDGCRVRVPAEVDRGLLADVLSVLEARRC
jgi:hypothetical protein